MPPMPLRDACAASSHAAEFGAVFYSGAIAGWAPGSFMLSSPKAMFQVSMGEEVEPQEGSRASIFKKLEEAVHSEPDLVWAGFISYDAGRFIETIPSIAARDRPLPFVFFVGYDSVIPVISEENRAPNASARFDFSTNHRAGKLDMDGPSCLASLEELPTGWKESLGRSEYEKVVLDALERIKAGDFYQVNVARRISAPCLRDPREDAIDAFVFVCDVLLPPRGCFLAWNDAFVVSGSPELFLSVTGRNVFTKPIKGTFGRWRTRTASDLDVGRLRLLTSDKDKAENVMIVDLLRNDLGKISEYGSVKVPALFHVETFPAVHHLVSTVTATLRKDVSLADLLEATFPGGSITGAPKVAAMRFIESVERVRRGVYTGAIGYVDPSHRLSNSLGMQNTAPTIEFSVAIRTLVLWEGWWDLWVGGGIVADSDPVVEWQETVEKSRGLVPVLAGFTTAPPRP